ncbi:MULTISPECIES: hypothetical protein [unclassified Cyanobium]|uniref:hypothetical protein n=1 Tax=unclassified Cyanobium TaxID=2627006 RepID=UPI0020CC7462|nr:MULTISPECIES: hypothetical protein [unclassified Cyanobium]MCP9777395.1 hypothetical protein [Cyanobium sp. Tous-M-B4]MCP9876350.1 hypothetical protein [Cyanobium sp. A2C-AMD]
MEVLGAALGVAAERCVTKLARLQSNGASCQRNQTEAAASMIALEVASNCKQASWMEFAGKVSG